MRILILAAGYGTRLYPLTIDLPKALIPIDGDTVLDLILYKINKLDNADIEQIALISNDRFYSNFIQWQQESGLNVDILNDKTTSPENRLGAIGDIRFVLNQLPEDDWLVIGSDNYFSWDLNKFLEFAKDKKDFPSLGVYKLDNKERCKKFGILDLDEEKKIVDFQEKPENPKSNNVAVCLYYFPKKTIKLFNTFVEETGVEDMVGKYIEWLIKKTDVYGYVFNGQWFDIGDKETLEEIKKAVGQG